MTAATTIGGLLVAVTGLLDAGSLRPAEAMSVRFGSGSQLVALKNT